MTSFAAVLEAFFTDRLTAQRTASPHTVAAYRDTFKLLLTFTAARTGKQRGPRSWISPTWTRP